MTQAFCLYALQLREIKTSVMTKIHTKMLISRPLIRVKPWINDEPINRTRWIKYDVMMGKKQSAILKNYTKGSDITYCMSKRLAWYFYTKHCNQYH